MASRRISATGARPSGSVGSDVPAAITVTRRAASVSFARGVMCPPFASSTVAPTSIVRASASVMISNRFTLLVQHRDVRQVAILLIVVESIANHELVLDREPDVFDGHFDLPTGRLAQQAGGANRSRCSPRQDLLQVLQRAACIDDVFHQQDVPVFDAGVEVLLESDLTRRLGARSVARYRD